MSKKLSVKKDKRKILTVVKILSIVVLTITTFIAYILAIAFLRGKSLDSMIADSSAGTKADLGVELVRAMYDFENPYELDKNMLVVQKLVTEDVFSDLTIDNEQRTLSTYFKFKDTPVHVNILKSMDSYVLYSLDSEAISADRKFILIFSVNEEGIIDEVKEMECYEYLNSIY